MIWPATPRAQPRTITRERGSRTRTHTASGARMTVCGSVNAATSATKARPSAVARSRGIASRSHGVRYSRYQCTLARESITSTPARGTRTGTAASCTRPRHRRRHHCPAEHVYQSCRDTNHGGGGCNHRVRPCVDRNEPSDQATGDPGDEVLVPGVWPEQNRPRSIAGPVADEL